MADGAAPSPATIADGPSFRAAVCVTFCACSAAPSPATIADGPSFRAAVCVTFCACSARQRFTRAAVTLRPWKPVRYLRTDDARHAAAQSGEHANRPPRARETEWTQRGQPSRLHRTLRRTTTGPRPPVVGLGGWLVRQRRCRTPPATTRGPELANSGPFFFLAAPSIVAPASPYGQPYDVAGPPRPTLIATSMGRRISSPQ